MAPLGAQERTRPAMLTMWRIDSTTPLVISIRPAGLTEPWRAWKFMFRTLLLSATWRLAAPIPA